MDELLDRAGVDDRYLTMSLAEVSAAFENLSYQEAYDLARKIVAARQAIVPILRQYKDTPEEQKLTVESMQRNMIAILSFHDIAEREEKQANDQGDSARAAQVSKERQEIRHLAKEAA